MQEQLDSPFSNTPSISEFVTRQLCAKLTRQNAEQAVFTPKDELAVHTYSAFPWNS